MISFAEIKTMLVSGFFAAASFAAAAQTVTFSIDGNVDIHAVKINANGTVAGWYSTLHSPGAFFQDFFGFVRLPTGELTTFAIPAVSPYISTTQVHDINDAGVLVGDGYCSESSCTGGYIRDPAGQLTPIDAPQGSRVIPLAINNSGTVTGTWSDASFAIHGFVRANNGAVTTFDAPGPSAASSAFQTSPSVINDRGDVAGTAIDDASSAPPDSGIFHVFLRRANGVFTRFDIPGNGALRVAKLDNNGRITGEAVGLDGIPQSFTISVAGKLVLTLLGGKKSVFPVKYPGAMYTEASGANNLGAVVGTYNGSDFVYHGFIRNPLGQFTSIDIDGGIDTIPTSVNNNGMVAGEYRDTNLVYHGFIRIGP